VLKLLVGLIKGAVIGSAIGYGASQVEIIPGWLTYGLVGALVGFIAGRPIWSLILDKNATSVVAILRAAVGFGVGCGAYALVNRVWAPGPLMVSGVNVFSWPLVGAVGAVWGSFLELDDSIGADAAAKEKAEKADKADKADKAETSKTNPVAKKQLKK
jgi:hypothetical protein